MVGARRLLQTKFRRETGTFLVEGAQAVREALESRWRVVELFATPEGAARNADLVAAATAAAVPIRLGDEEALDAISDTKTPQGIVAVVEWQAPSVSEVMALDPRLAVGLVDCADPGNLGSVIRVADAAGADVVFLTPDCVDPTNPKVVRATTGSIFHLPVVTEVAWPELMAGAHAAGMQVLATTGHEGAVDLFELRSRGEIAQPMLWLFGSEAHGLPDSALAQADHQVRIPIRGRAESLNLATAVAVALYALPAETSP